MTHIGGLLDKMTGSVLLTAKEVKEVEDHIDQLQAENAKLREKAQRQANELTALRKAIEQRNGELRPWKRQAERLVAENAKLREWCSDFWKWADPPFTLKSGTFDEYMTLVERAMKLGIEVD